MAIFFPAYFENPLKIRYAKQEDNEKIILLLRQHWVTNLPWIFMVILLCFVPTLIFRVNSIFNIVKLDFPIQVQTILTIDWYLLVLSYAIEKFLFWYFNLYIVTNLHLIDVNFNSLLSQDTTETQMKDIESIAASYRGIVGPMFNYGDVVIETAAKDQSIVFSAIPFPHAVADMIQKLEERSENASE